MLRIIIITIFILIFSFISYSQIIIQDSIFWDPVKSFTIKNGNKQQKFYYLKFSGALYNNTYLLPYYTKVIDIPFNADIHVSLTKTNFIRYEQKHKVKGIDKIPSNIFITTKVFKSRNKYKLIISILPVKKNLSQIYLLNYFSLSIKLTRKKDIITKKTLISSSVMASGHWVKIAIPYTGIYRISYDTLRELGFNDPTRVRVFGNDFGQLPYYNNQYAPDDLKENLVLHKNNYIYFFAKDANIWYYDTTFQMFLLKEHDYCDTAFYFLSDVNTGFNNNIPTLNEPNSYNTQTDYYLWYDFRGQKLHNYPKSGRMWFDVGFLYNTSRTFTFRANSILSLPAKAYITFMARAYINTSLTVQAENQTSSIIFSPIPGTITSNYGIIKSKLINFIPQNTDKIEITLNYNGTQSSSRGALDYITVNAQRKLIFEEGQQLLFRNIDVVGIGKITKFTIYQIPNDLIIWDITNPTEPKQLTFEINNNNASFIVQTDSIREFIAFNPTSAYQPIFTGKFLGSISNQNLHAISANTEMIIITYPDFIESAQRLAQIHQQYDSLNVKVVTTEQVYNEFSSGIPDAVAIRNFLRSLYTKTNSKLKYALLFGDGSYKNKSDKNNKNLIPTYQTLNSLNTNGYLSLTSDDFYGLLDYNEGETQGLMDISTGRIPVQTKSQANLIVDKIEHYYINQRKNMWKTKITFVADDGENNLFMEQMENVSQNLYNNNPQLIIKKIYLDAYPAQILYSGQEYPEAATELTNNVEQGTLILAFNGHGNEHVLASERIITLSDVRNWNNMNNLTFMITATCLFGRFDNYDNREKKDIPSGIEYGLFNQQGGFIGAFSTTRMSYISVNYVMLNNFLNNIFTLSNNEALTLGEAIRISKEQNSSYHNRLFALIADPALKLNFPSETIDNITISHDTLKSLSYVKISGSITNENGQIINDFNGDMTIKIFDKPQYYYTLNNDGVGAFRYLDYKNLIYNGIVSVKDGRFELNFLVPKDIDYNYGTGKIIFYATDNNKEFLGYKLFTIGGENDTTINDNQGPQITIFLNDTSVSSNITTDRNPKIIIKLSDQSGINLTNYGLGHQIQLIVNNKQTYNLNEYFIYDKDNNKQGKIEFKLYKLQPGKQKITVKAFDVLNNSSEKSIEFTVTDQNNFIINRIFNYPNPFTTKTNFYFEHNQINKPLFVSLNIYSISGKLIKQFAKEMICNSYLSEPIEWDGRDNFGNIIAKGVYIYIFTVKLETGQTVQKIGKLLKI